MKKLMPFLLLLALILVSCKQEVHVHTWDEGSVTAAPSCVSIGTKTYTCTACGETRMEVLQKTEHLPGGEKTIAPTCTAAGYTETVCTVCGKVLGHTETEPSGHQWDEGTVVKQADCTSIGAVEYRCLRCDEKKTEIIEKTGHVQGEETVVPPTCTECGYRETVCSVCGLVYEHEILPLAPHEWNEGTVTREPTCTSIGTMEKTCRVCNETRIVVLDAKGHTEGEPEVVEAGCTQDGYEKTTCTECGQVVRCTVHQATGHHFHAVETVPGTCITKGSEYHICENCSLAERIELDYGDHAWDEGTVTTQPSCTGKGEVTYTCTVCGETKTEEIPMNEHDFVYDRTETEANCVECGLDIYRCSVCGLEKDVEIPVDPDNHLFPISVTETENGYFTKGLEKEICDACGEHTGEYSETDIRILKGYWKSEPVIENIDGIDTEVWYEINFKDWHMTGDLAYRLEDKVMAKAGIIDIDYSISLNKDKEQEGWIARIKGLSRKASYEVTGETGTSFTIRLEGLEEWHEFTFSMISEENHEHQIGPVCEKFDDWMHKYKTTCTDHEEYTILKSHVYEDDEEGYDHCLACGTERLYELSMRDGGKIFGLYAKHSTGIVLPEIENGNSWFDEDNEEYYLPGETYYPGLEGDKKFYSVTI